MSNAILTQKETIALRAIRNSFIHNGVAPSMRDLMRILEYKSSYSALLVVNSLTEKGFLEKSDGQINLTNDIESDKTNTQTTLVPLVGNVACGTPLLAQENIEARIPVSVGLVKPGYNYFLLRAVGDSMNKKNINDGDLVLVRKEQTAENGDIIVALINDEATIKEFQRTENLVLLKPKSNNLKHKPIILNEDFLIQGKVISTIKGFH